MWGKYWRGCGLNHEEPVRFLFERTRHVGNITVYVTNRGSVVWNRTEHNGKRLLGQLPLQADQSYCRLTGILGWNGAERWILVWPELNQPEETWTKPGSVLKIKSSWLMDRWECLAWFLNVLRSLDAFRRESERRNHSLARHADILAAVETRLSLLNMTFMKYVDSNLCCFIPGKVSWPIHTHTYTHRPPKLFSWYWGRPFSLWEFFKLYSFITDKI